MKAGSQEGVEHRPLQVMWEESMQKEKNLKLLQENLHLDLNNDVIRLWSSAAPEVYCNHCSETALSPKLEFSFLYRVSFRGRVQWPEHWCCSRPLQYLQVVEMPFSCRTLPEWKCRWPCLSHPWWGHRRTSMKNFCDVPWRLFWHMLKKIWNLGRQHFLIR